MPKRCAVYNCRGNYNGEPYSSLVSFPKDTDTRNLWIDSMPNDRSTLENRKEIWICASHFDCPWITVKGGKRPSNPPTLFDGVPKSCMKQVQNKKRSTVSTSSDV